MATYTDLDLNFLLHPRTHDVSMKVDTSAIFTSLKNLIKTANFERPFHPEIGCQITSLLFEQMTSDVVASIQRTIKYTITNFEPRVEVLDVKVTPNDHTITIDLTFKILALNIIQNAKFELERTL
ncbi:MAG TPA: GPW/gp25 family protein [Methanosarcina sp.]|nr:GPW/gp25 family protein [Methanosarcina sp.]